MKFLAPARLQALAILGGLLTMCLMTQDSCTWLDFHDEDSVAQLSKDRICQLARERSGTLEGAKCDVIRSTDEMAEVQLNSTRTVCFLKAGRWFVIDPDAASDCPTEPPITRRRVNTLREEEKLELEWVNALRMKRDQSAHAFFLERFKTSVENLKTVTDVPHQCPEFEKGWVDSVDADIFRPSTASIWNYLTNDQLELLITNSATWGAGTQIREYKRNTPYILFVDAKEKIAPFQHAPGVFHGRVALIDWWNAKVLCAANVDFEQPTDSYRDPESIAEYLSDFKVQMTAALKATVISMSNGQLQLTDTY